MILVDPAWAIERILATCEAAVSWDSQDVHCARCERRLCTAVKTSARHVGRFVEEPIMHLDAGAYCRWCGRPITAAALAKQEEACCHAFARALLRLDRGIGHYEPIGTESLA